jgi:glucose/arabinose dehydrogenase
MPSACYTEAMKASEKRLLGPAAVLLLVLINLVLWKAVLRRVALVEPPDVPSSQGTEARIAPPPPQEGISVVAQDLRVPWDIAFLPDGDMLVTERAGTLRRIGAKPFEIDVTDAFETGEGGLHGIALHPRFAENDFIYLYRTVRENGVIRNRVDRFRLADGQLLDRTPIVTDIPGAHNHDGGRIAFGPDGKLYVTSGDAEVAEAAQDRASLSGKILRVNEDGTVPEDNPFGSPVWSYGHRNPQGLTWDDQGRLWATEHGPSGGATGHDELNLIEKGKNYGWPTIVGDQKQAGMINPIVHSGSKSTWAPAGAAWLGGSVFFGGLRGQTLYEFRYEDGKPTLKGHFVEVYGRIRAVEAGPDGSLYISTSNRDGRGGVRTGDDKIFRISPSALGL